MRAIGLMENAACTPELASAHGLSVYVEANGAKLLLDMGPDGRFAQNARLLDVDLNAVEAAAVSHGHYDHGGGLRTFFEANDHAPVFVTPAAFEPYFSQGEFIGLDPELQNDAQTAARFRTAAPVQPIAPGVVLFTTPEGNALPSPANDWLHDAQGPDRFRHEQSMLVEEPAGETGAGAGDAGDAGDASDEAAAGDAFNGEAGCGIGGDGRLWLFGGCAHRGIVNILERAKQIVGRYPDEVVSGFHLALGGKGACAVDDAYLDELAQRLLATGATFHTCHCTGTEAFDALKQRMGDRLQPFHAGTVLEG